MDKTTLAYNCYIENTKIVNQGKTCWLSNVHKLLSTSKLTHIKNEIPYFEVFTDTELVMTLRKSYHSKIIKIFKKSLMGVYKEQFQADLLNDFRQNGEGNKLRTYRSFKFNIQKENYLQNIKDRDMRIAMCRLRISAHNLPIEKGRHRRPQKVPVLDRVCDLCNSGEICDEPHIISMCQSLQTERKIFYDKMEIHVKGFNNMTNMGKFTLIMQCDTPEIAQDLTNYLRQITTKRGNL